MPEGASRRFRKPQAAGPLPTVPRKRGRNCAFTPSWPNLSGNPRLCLDVHLKDVDACDERGHDENRSLG